MKIFKKITSVLLASLFSVVMIASSALSECPDINDIGFLGFRIGQTHEQVEKRLDKLGYDYGFSDGWAENGVMYRGYKAWKKTLSPNWKNVDFVFTYIDRGDGKTVQVSFNRRIVDEILFTKDFDTKNYAIKVKNYFNFDHLIDNSTVIIDKQTGLSMVYAHNYYIECEGYSFGVNKYEYVWICKE